MKLIFAIINKNDTDNVIMEINKAGYQVTKIASSGGFLRKGNMTLMIGVNDEEVSKVIGTIKEVCGERTEVEVNVPYIPSGSFAGNGNAFYGTTVKQKVEVGGAILFVVNVDHYEKI